MFNVTQYYPLGIQERLYRGNYPFLFHTAPGPRPWQINTPAACCSRSTRRTISRLTPGHACSSALIANPLPGIAVSRAMLANTSSRFEPRGALI